LKQKITVLLVDNHAVVSNGFRRVLEDDPELTVVGESGEGVRAVRMAKQLQPTVVRALALDCNTR
jgi:chemotaxis response regulator CheB